MMSRLYYMYSNAREDDKMGYVAYNTTTTIKLTGRTYKSAAAAKSAITRAAKKGSVVAADYAVADTEAFYNGIEKMVERKNALTGQTYMEAANTPRSCSPSSELYWCM